MVISVPDGATPMMIDSPQPRWQHSSAWRISVDVADALEGEVGAAAGEVDDGLDDLVAPDLVRVDEMRHAEPLGHLALPGLRSTPMILSAPTMRAPWITLSPMPPRPNTTTLAPGHTLAV